MSPGMELNVATVASGNRHSVPSLPAEQHDLVVAHTALVYSIATKVSHAYRVPDSVQDLCGYGYLGLIEAATRYRPESRVPFVSFAYHRVRGAIVDGLRRQGWQTRAEYAAQLRSARANADSSVASAVMAAPVLSAEITESIAGDEETRVGIEDSLDLRRAVAELPELERNVLDRYYFADQTLEEIAVALGVTKSWVCKLHARGIELVRTRLEARSGGAVP